MSTTNLLPDAETVLQLEKSEPDSMQLAFYYKEIGEFHAQNNAFDSAWIYYRKALDISMKQDSRDRFTSLLFNNVAKLHLSNKEYKEALECVEKSMQYRANRKDATLFNLTKARIFISMNEKDSARIYLNRTIESSSNNYITIMAYSYLSDLYKYEGNYEQALYKLLNYNNFIDLAQMDINTTVLSQRYKEVQLENENNALKLAKRNREFALLSVVFLTTVVSIILWHFYSSGKKKEKIHSQQQREQELKNQATIAEQENRLLKQEKELSWLNEKTAVLRESLFRKLTVSEKIPSLDISGNQEKEYRRKKIALEISDWEELIETIDEVFNGYSFRLKKAYPNLSDDDIQFCCLLKINVSMQDLADIYCISKAGITKRKMRMKKDKFNITDNQLDLNEFLLMY
jgi:tetratricopeptide (TPR) repeat protein